MPVSAEHAAVDALHGVDCFPTASHHRNAHRYLPQTDVPTDTTYLRNADSGYGIHADLSQRRLPMRKNVPMLPIPVCLAPKALGKHHLFGTNGNRA